MRHTFGSTQEQIEDHICNEQYYSEVFGELLMRLARWTIDFNENCRDTVGRLWLKFGCAPARAKNDVWDWDDGYKVEGAVVYPPAPYFSVKEACDDLNWKSADKRLHDICLILHHGYEP